MLTTAAQRRDFDDNGFTVVRSLVDAPLLEPLRAEYEQLVAEAPPATPESDDGPEAMTWMQHPSKAVPHWSEHQYFVRAHEVSAELLGEPTRYHDDLLLMKPAGCDVITPWHQDAPYYEGEGIGYERAVACWLALSDVTAEAGGMQFIPGSHRWGIVQHEEVENEGIPEALEAQGFDRTRAVSPHLHPGDATFHHCRVLHYCTGNTTDGPRMGIVTHFWPG